VTRLPAGRFAPARGRDPATRPAVTRERTRTAPRGRQPATRSAWRARGGSSPRSRGTTHLRGTVVNGCVGAGVACVSPLPPVPGPVGSARRPLSNEDFEEELDIPEFLRG
jgi:cell division protein FtsZ